MSIDVGSALAKAIENGLLTGNETPLRERKADMYRAIKEMAPDLEARFYDHFQASEDASTRYFKLAYAECERGEKACESPIERIALASMIFADYGDYPGVPVVHLPDEEPLFPERDYVIVPQFRFLNYRFDFAFIAKARGHQKLIAIECDGEPFHQDWRKDRARNAYLASWGMTVLRASGKDINRDCRLIGRAITHTLSVWKGGLA